MDLIESSNSLHLALKALFDHKSRRDGKLFTLTQLATAINMPHSMLVKLMHTDPEKRVHNPRIDTLAKIVDYFKNDGYDITIDNLLEGFKNSSAIPISDQKFTLTQINKTINIYSTNVGLENSIGTINVNINNDSNDLIAFWSDEDIKPIFKKGSVFIVDKALKPENDTLVAVKLENQDKVLIRKYYVEKHKRILKSYEEHVKPIVMLPTEQSQIIGVVIQVNAKT